MFPDDYQVAQAQTLVGGLEHAELPSRVKGSQRIGNLLLKIEARALESTGKKRLSHRRLTDIQHLGS